MPTPRTRTLAPASDRPHAGTQGKDVTIRLHALDGVWEVGGVDRKRGIVPENVSLSADLWGSSAASFELRRDPRAVWPDLGAFTPVEIEIGGMVVWSGRIRETPSRDSADRVISVQAQGWQYHLDDDLYERTYVHTRLGDWRDYRSASTLADLTLWPTSGQVSNEGGGIVLAYPAGATVMNGKAIGVTLDLGLGSVPKRIVVALAWLGTTSPDDRFFARSHDTPAGAHPAAVGASDAIALNAQANANGTYAGSFTTTTERYVTLFFYRNAGAADYTASGPTGAGVRVTSVQVFSDTAYESQLASVLRASTVIGDALAKATVLLDADRTAIQQTSFNVPELVVGDPKTPREVWAAVNAYHDWVAQVDVRRRPVYRAKPSVPKFETGAWSALELEDQSANSSEEIYNRVIVTGTQPDGTPLRVGRSQADITRTARPPFGYEISSGPDVITRNAGFSRDTYQYAPDGVLPLTFVYRIKVTWTAAGGSPVWRLRFGTTTDYVEATTSASGSVVTLIWTPVAKIPSPGGPGLPVHLTYYLDSGSVSQWSSSEGFAGQVMATLPDRRGFRRTKTLPLSGALTQPAAQQIGDLWLAAHKTTPYKGTLKLTGDRAVRDPATGAPVPLERLLLATGELIRDTAAIDPDTGGIGRDGRIATVTITPATSEATVTLDNSRASFEALLQRLGALGVG